MLGAIAGDIIGSVYERDAIKTPFFSPLFDPNARPTDDTVLTVALADSLLSGIDYIDKLHEYYAAYPFAGYGGAFRQWADSRLREPYNSFGNGSAMRVSPVGYAFDTLEEVMEQARRSAVVTHSHPEGIKGAQATATAIFLARQKASKDAIRDHLEGTFGYNLSRPLTTIRPWYLFDVTCQGSVPEAIIAFLEADSLESAIRNAISLGGDSDTQACIAGSIAEAAFGVPAEIEAEVFRRLDERLARVTREFRARYGVR
jgi:ADP-ribosylglycohydrolase